MGKVGRFLIKVSVIFLLTVTIKAQLTSFFASYAIVGAKVVVKNGHVLEKATIFIRNGLIESVGSDIPVPPDAQIIKGEGLIVYPGFIDAYTTQGLNLPDWQPDQDIPPNISDNSLPFMREANRKGVRPELQAVDCLALDSSVLEPYRRAGFTTALLAPSGGCINGVSALVNLSGVAKRNYVVKSVVAMHFAFHSPSIGGYPDSLLGIFAHLRQTLLDAHHFRSLQASFENSGGKRPPFDETLSALQPILNGTMPVVFDADTENEIRRAIKFADEFNLSIIINGGQEAWKVINELVKRKIPVLVSISFGLEPPLPYGEKKTEGQKILDNQGNNVSQTEKEKDLPDLVLKDRRTKWEEKVANAVKLHQAGVLFAFTTKGLQKPTEFWQNLRRVIQVGLPKDVALQALTVNPAKIFGVDKLIGTAERGKIANLTVMTDEFTEEKAKVKYLFIDGIKFEP